MDLFSAQPQPQSTSHLEYHRPPTTTQPHTHLSTRTTTDTKTTTATTPMTTNLLPTPGRWTLVLTIRRQVGGELRGGTAAAPPLQAAGRTRNTRAATRSKVENTRAAHFAKCPMHLAIFSNQPEEKRISHCCPIISSKKCNVRSRGEVF